jgi:hypothetical protein
LRCCVLSLSVVLAGMGFSALPARADASSAILQPGSVTFTSTSDTCANPDCAVDGDAATECTFTHDPNVAGDVNAALTIALKEPSVITAVLVTNGAEQPMRWVSEIEVGGDGVHFRPLLGRYVNLPMFEPKEEIPISVAPAVARYVRVTFGGVRKGGIGEVALLGRPNRPERHLLFWAGGIQRDYLDKLDYLDKELGVTDIWMDHVDSAFPQTVTNGGFRAWTDSGVLKHLEARDIRYWLCEHEAFTSMVNSPQGLRDDLRWETTMRQMRAVYAEARDNGFRGLVFDAEDYTGVAQSALEQYKDVADHVDAWCFADEFGYAGAYYQRGLRVGGVIKEVWPEAVLIQLYEARMYAGVPGCRDGNYWWLKAIHDAGIEIWVATEKTYGAGRGEIDIPETPRHLKNWFVKMPVFVPKVHEAFPFAARVLPGFHPWNARTKAPNYLPRYLDEQLTVAETVVQGYWIYNEGNPSAGDPRDVLDPETCARHGVKPEEYIEVFQRHPAGQRRP